MSNAQDGRAKALRSWIKTRVEILEPFTVNTLSCIESKLNPLTYHQSWLIEDTSLNKTTEINQNIDSKLKQWKEANNTSTINALESLEKIIEEYSSSIDEISKDANNLFQNSEDSFESLLNVLKANITLFFHDLRVTVMEKIIDENLISNDLKIEVYKHEKFNGGFVITDALVNEFQRCYKNFLEGRDRFVNETKNVLIRVADMALKSLDNIDACKKTHKVDSLLDLNNASDQTKADFNTCLTYVR